MATIKSYTDLEQSRKLAEILPLESADMYYSWIGTAYLLHAESYNKIIAWRKEYAKTHNNPSFCTSIIPCWSLAALLNIIKSAVNYAMQSLGSKKSFIVCELGDNPWSLIAQDDNEIDACVEVIERLHELNLL